MKQGKQIFLSLAALAIAGSGLIIQPANASKESDAATRAAARMHAMQQGLPADYYDQQHAAQMGTSYNPYQDPSLYSPYQGNIVNPYVNGAYGYVAPNYYGNTYNPYGFSNGYSNVYPNTYSSRPRHRRWY